MTEQQQELTDVTVGYKFPDHFLYVEVLLFSLISTLLIFAWIPVLMSLFTYGTVLVSAIRAALFLNVTAIALFLFSKFLKNELQAVTFILTDQFLIHRTSVRVRQIALADIQRIAFIQLPLNGGIASVESSRGVINIPFFVRNSGELIEKLEVLCREKAIAFSQDGAAMKRIRDRCELSTMVQRRTSEAFSTIISLCIGMLPANVFIGAFFWNMSIIPLAGWAVIGPLFPIFGYLSADIIMRYYERKAQQRGNMNGLPAIKSIVIARLALVVMCSYCITAIIYKAFIL